MNKEFSDLIRVLLPTPGIRIVRMKIMIAMTATMMRPLAFNDTRNQALKSEQDYP